MRKPYVYILSNKKHGTLYIGVTTRLYTRVQEHKEGIHEGFTKKYGLHKLVWFEQHDLIIHAIVMEKRIKNRRRIKKIALIEKINPEWTDLSKDWLDV